MLINRVTNTDMTWNQEVTNAAPRVSPIVDLTLDDNSVLRAIDNLNFIQMKCKLTKLRPPSHYLALTNCCNKNTQKATHNLQHSALQPLRIFESNKFFN